jgi:hypothetical protein
MTLRYPDVADRVHRRYPFFRSTYFERRMLFERFLPTPDVSIQPEASRMAQTLPFVRRRN